MPMMVPSTNDIRHEFYFGPMHREKNSPKNRNVPRKRTNDDFNLDDESFVFVEGGIDGLVTHGIEL
jgi:hypothetical protein